MPDSAIRGDYLLPAPRDSSRRKQIGRESTLSQEQQLRAQKMDGLASWQVVTVMRFKRPEHRENPRV